MCGRFTLTTSVEDLIEYFDIRYGINFSRSFNIAPSQNILVVRNNEENKREFALMRWGFIPQWLQEDKISSKWINARAETADEKPIFRNAFKHRRCLIVTDGFYEWQGTKVKKSFYIRKKDKKPFGIAGLWERWEGDSGKIIESCTILTTDANPLLKTIHHRMPVILQRTEFPMWLDNTIQNVSKLQHLLRPYQPDNLEMYEVSAIVNNPAHNSDECIKNLDLKTN